MLIGDIQKIDLGSSSFERLITNGNLYVDKTKFIERFLNVSSSVQLVARQRRLGKSLNMDMLRCFLADKTVTRHLFKGLYIETSSVWNMVNSAPVFYFDFKSLNTESYKQQIIRMVDKHISSYINLDELSGYLKRLYEKFINYPDAASDGLLILTELVYEVTGKRSYLLIDEYDKLLMDSYNTEKYDEIRSFETALLSSGLKGNHYLEKALLTGVMRVSHESMLSGLNNIVTFDVFGDEVYTDDYGLTDMEVVALQKLAGFDIDELRSWYNGIRIGGKAIYNIYAVMSYLERGRYDCFWGKSGVMDMIIDLMNDSRNATLARLLSGEKSKVAITNRISLRHISSKTSDQAFYSFLVQSGYLALDEAVSNKDATALVSIPNKELVIAWKEFILENMYTNIPQLITLFDNVDNLDMFSKNIERFLCDKLSFYDLSVYKGEDDRRAHERVYHVFLLGILSAYDDVRCQYPLSNRESGDGRYDVFVERFDRNYIFEFKACDPTDDLDTKADEALAQIEYKRYGSDVKSKNSLVKVGIALRGKTCRVKCK